MPFTHKAVSISLLPLVKAMICEGNNSKMELQFFLRMPKFPMVGNIEGHFIGAGNARELSCKLAEIQLNEEEGYDLVDFTGEGWSLFAPEMIISPLTIKKRWTKLEIITLFNERKNVELGEGRVYSVKSMSSKRIGKIISDLVAMS
ncbi:MAG: hypothetical protein ACOCWZ_00305 [Spirochaetota bacterium]